MEQPTLSMILEKLYFYRFEAGKNILYNRGIEAWWNRIDMLVKILMTSVGVVGFVCAFVNEPFWLEIGLATIATLGGLILLLYDTGAKVRDYRVAREKWQEFKDELQTVQMHALARRTKADIERAWLRLDELESKHVRIESSEPTEEWERFLAECYQKQIEHTYGVDIHTGDDVKTLLSKNPKEWARKRYGVLLEEPLLTEVLANFEPRPAHSLPAPESNEEHAALAAIEVASAG